MNTVISVIDFGAQPGKDFHQTAAFQSALDAVWKLGGGTVLVPAGQYRIGGLRIRSNTTLHLCSGAVLLGSRNADDYACLRTETLESLKPEHCTDKYWEPFVEGVQRCYDFMLPGGRWSNAILRAIDAHHVTIEGEPGSVIDGCDCYDENGEERYRGPHGICMHGCTNVRFSGYTIQNTGNWAHCIFNSTGIELDNVTVLAGHDGIHLTTCKNIYIHNSNFYTGDDCVAGFNNTNLYVTGCILNTACNALRLGGTNVLIRKCHIFGPGKYFFRGSLSLAEKQNGAKAHIPHRTNMLSMFTYYADFSVDILQQPGNIIVEDCFVENADRFLHYNFSGNERWQSNRPLESITFRNITAKGVKLPLTAYGSAELPLTLIMRHVKLFFDETTAIPAFMHVANCERIVLDHVLVRKELSTPFIKSWGNSGHIELKQVDYPGEQSVIHSQEPFVCQSI